MYVHKLIVITFCVYVAPNSIQEAATFIDAQRRHTDVRRFAQRLSDVDVPSEIIRATYVHACYVLDIWSVLLCFHKYEMDIDAEVVNITQFSRRYTTTSETTCTSNLRVLGWKVVNERVAAIWVAQYVRDVSLIATQTVDSKIITADRLPPHNGK